MEDMSLILTTVFILAALAGLLVFYVFLGSVILRYFVKIVKSIWNSGD
jgi:hypothetical protein